MRKLLAGTAAFVAAGITAGAAVAEYPERPITVINPNSAGGGTDVGIRTWAPFVEQCLGNGATLVPEARPGAASAVGITALAQSAPDGYTVGSTNMPNLVTTAMTTDVPYTIDSFEYLGNLVGVRSTLNVHRDSDIQTLEDAIALAKEGGGPINVAMGGVGADDHLVGLQLEKLLGADFNFIPFGSGADSRNALLGGQVQFAMMSNSEAAQFKDEIRTLAIAAEERSPLLPDAPTFQEKGYDLIGGSDHIISAPKGFPAEALEKWRACIEQTASNPEFLEQAAKRQVSLNLMNAEEADAFVRRQQEILSELWENDPWIKQ